MNLVLASQSASRRAMLDAAGIPYSATAALVDEASVKESMLAGGTSPRDLSDALAEMKAVKVSRIAPRALVLGSDSIVALADGTLLDKPVSREDAVEHLRRMSGGTHDLFSAAVMAENGLPVWRFVDRAKLHVRVLTEAFIESYLDEEWPAISGCVGCFRIEGPGVQLFSRIDGSHFTILGMPLLPVLDYCRTRGILTA